LRALKNLFGAGEFPPVHGVVVFNVLLGVLVLLLPADEAVYSLLDSHVGRRDGLLMEHRLDLNLVADLVADLTRDRFEDVFKFFFVLVDVPTDSPD